MSKKQWGHGYHNGKDIGKLEARIEQLSGLIMDAYSLICGGCDPLFQDWARRCEVIMDLNEDETLTK